MRSTSRLRVAACGATSQLIAFNRSFGAADSDPTDRSAPSSAHERRRRCDRRAACASFRAECVSLLIAHLENRRVRGSRIDAQGLAGRRTVRASANHSTLIRALSIRIRLRARARHGLGEKKFRACRIALARTRARLARHARLSSRGSRGSARRASDVTESLESCGFLHRSRKHEVTHRISRATRAGTTRCVVIA
jgi:hypothetical protein